ncbi:carboxypeptidase-like regulatory domain-containing protein [Flavobacterium sp. MAH-1]|uniref:Carboxypeptidase-like regulatory domain-containing protein n=1 Tax=Flavobacterium agri TaxID=2743471 RepID=A0A7Y9C4E0_9FLAO|nr:carboxypeptidase-like regulatory domain-containing protein [Flavobacterium agri]NUY79785.1 carboxypeptidase-like regulatory domain-containing protein [Flavobacterium agri]NYA69810.1 carboxypeptidase-like regulatory domain-containing protein [Flavobacterium agri]
MKLLVLLLFTSIAFSQTISGIVYDENKLVMPGVSVYLDGTSIGTVSDENGNFRISSSQMLNSMLVLRFIGYETIYIQNPFEKAKYTVYMNPKPDELKEVVVNRNKSEFKRKDMLKVFREQFLGKTEAGRACTILNEDDLEFRYDTAHNRLITTSQNPLKIMNSHLGYEVEFNLIESTIGFGRKTVNAHEALYNAYQGTVVFKEIPDASDKFFKRRQVVYYGSREHLMRCVIDGKWDKSGFELYKNRTKINADDFFTVIYDNGLYSVKVKPEEASEEQLKKGLKHNPHSTLFVYYREDEASTLHFMNLDFKMDANGNTGSAYDISYAGAMSLPRVGDLLPLDYSP